eukprot:s1382_g17.t1
MAVRGVSKDAVLTTDELSNAFQSLQGLKPKLSEEADFDLENVKEVLLFLQFMWKNAKNEAHGIALAVTAIVCFRCYCGGRDFQDVRYVDNLVFDKDGGPCPMLQKIHQQGFPTAMIQRKMDECRAALSYMEDIVTHWDDGTRIACAFSAAYQVIADSLSHLTCYLSAKDIGHGKLRF